MVSFWYSDMCRMTNRHFSKLLKEVDMLKTNTVTKTTFHVQRRRRHQKRCSFVDGFDRYRRITQFHDFYVSWIVEGNTL